MPILYCATAHEKNILAEYASCDGNFIEITQQMLSKIPITDDKMTYFHGTYLIHYIVENKHAFMCITDKLCQRSRAFLFLNEIHRHFLKNNRENFKKLLADEMYRFNEDSSTIVIRQGELDELNRIGVESSETILGEKMLFVNNTENLSYAMVTSVGAIPEQVSITEKKPKLYVCFVFITGFLILVLGAISILGLTSSVFVICAAVISFKSYFSDNEND